MANNNPSMVSNSMRNPSKEFPYIGESVDIYDNQLEKNQQTINNEVITLTYNDQGDGTFNRNL